MKLDFKKIAILVCGGVLSGFVNGFLGGGGGVLIVTLLLWILQLQQKQAQATALLIVLPLTIVSAIVYFVEGNVSWTETLLTTLGVVAGGIVGALLLGKLNGNVVKLIFALVLVAGGIKMFL